MEALPVRELELLLRQADGARAVFYAACRELQAAGETLRRERRLFTPDEVKQYVPDEEARTAARTVLALSGVEMDGDADEAEVESETADEPDKSDGKAAENRFEFISCRARHLGSRWQLCCLTDVAYPLRVKTLRRVLLPLVFDQRE